MEISPNLKSLPFGKLEGGDLCLVRDDTGPYVALAVADTKSSGNWALLFGPASRRARRSCANHPHPRNVGGVLWKAVHHMFTLQNRRVA